MAEKLDLKKFYEDTKITTEHVQIFILHSTLRKSNDKSFRMATVNTAFGMLAHLNITSNSETSFIKTRLSKAGVDSSETQAKFIMALRDLKILSTYYLNPTAITMIQRYRSVFDKYEAKLGIQNPFTKKTNNN